jgi:alpha-tubulin suppressor-like RCC1 family protein
VLGTTVLRRCLATMTTVAALVTATAPAQAATRHLATTHLHVVVTPTTARLRSVVVIAGTATPVTSAPVTLQRLVGKKWVTLAHVRATTKGAFTIRLRAPKRAATWSVRLTRAASKLTKPAATPVIHLHLVKSAFAITAAPAPATVHNGQSLVVAGTVSPKATGTVSLQKLSGKTWTTVAKANLATMSTYSVSTRLAVGSYTFRVFKSFSATVATGSSPPFAVTVLPAPLVPPLAPVVTTASLPAMVVGQRYATTLAATGTGPLTWSVTGGVLPTGLSLSTSGVLSGRPRIIGPNTFTVTAKDGIGQTASAAFSPPVDGVSVRSWGTNDDGQLGNGMNITSLTPVVAESPGSSWQTIDGSDKATIGLRTDGTVWTWGADDRGQLGVTPLVDKYDPFQLTGLSDVVSVSAGGSSAFAVTAAGVLWAWGSNDLGQLGNGTTTESDVPVQVPGLTGVVAVSAGGTFVLALKSDGTVWSSGADSAGQLGEGDTTPRLTPVQVLDIGATAATRAVAISAGFDDGYALLADGTVRSWGRGGGIGNGTFSNLFRPQVVTGLSDITAISAGVGGAIALHADGTVSSWGINDSGELGTNSQDMYGLVPVTVTSLSGVKAIAAGSDARYAVLGNGTVVAWGGYPLGNGGAEDLHVPTAVSGVTGAVDVGAGSGATYAIVAG